MSAILQAASLLLEMREDSRLDGGLVPLPGAADKSLSKRLFIESSLLTRTYQVQCDEEISYLPALSPANEEFILFWFRLAFDGQCRNRIVGGFFRQAPEAHMISVLIKLDLLSRR